MTAAVLMAPFVVIYGIFFVYPTIKMVELSFTNAPLIGPGKWVGLDNYFGSPRTICSRPRSGTRSISSSSRSSRALLLALVIALGVNRLKGWMQSIVLAAFFLPYILPVSVVYRIWGWMFDKDFGVAQYVIAPLNGGQHLSMFRTVPLFMPAVAFITVWWLLGFSLLLFIAGLRNISSEIYEAAELDGAGRWLQFRRITWPLIWPVTVLVFTIQLILQLKIFDQVYLFTQGGRIDATMVMVHYILREAFQLNKGGLGAAAAVLLFLVIVVLSVLQFQLLRARGRALSASVQSVEMVAPQASARRFARLHRLDGAGLFITISTSGRRDLWAFPLYWGLVTTFKHEYEIVRPGFQLWPEHFTFENYVHVLLQTKIGYWYINSLITSAAVTVIVVLMAAGAGYAISQLNFPGRRFFWWMILASFMVPIPALIVTHFIVISQLGLINTLAGVVGPQLIAPVTVIIYKQFFDSVPKDFREAAVIDGANDFQLLFRIYLPMNWGVTTALAIITFIGAWNLFLWPFLAVSSEDKMNITVGITQVHDNFGVPYGRDLAVATLAALPVALVYLIFQRRVTQAIMLSAGIKG